MKKIEMSFLINDFIDEDDFKTQIYAALVAGITEIKTMDGYISEIQFFDSVLDGSLIYISTQAIDGK